MQLELHELAREFEQLAREHLALLRQHGRAQRLATELLRARAREIDSLGAQLIRLRAAAIRRETELAWAREDRAALEQAIPDDAAGLEASLRAADLVICQTGCLSHGAYWRVQDHCQRTGKACVLVQQPRALRILRIQEAPEGGRPRIATLQAETGA